MVRYKMLRLCTLPTIRFLPSTNAVTIREAAWYIISVVSVCLSDDNFRKPWRRKFILSYSLYLQRMRVKFVYEGHQVKVKVTGAKSRKSIFPQCKNSIAHHSSSIKDRVTRYDVECGFWVWWFEVWPPPLSRDLKWPRGVYRA